MKGWGHKPRKPRMANSHVERQEEAGRAPVDLQRVRAALPHSISDLRPGTVREYISAVSCHPVCGNLHAALAH